MEFSPTNEKLSLKADVRRDLAQKEGQRKALSRARGILCGARTCGRYPTFPGAQGNLEQGHVPTQLLCSHLNLKVSMKYVFVFSFWFVFSRQGLAV